MRKAYLPRPSDITGTDNPRRVLITVPLEIDLNRSSDRFHCVQIQEPELIFGRGNRCVDPKTGLAAYGPYGLPRQGDTGRIRVGVVGTTEAIEQALELLQEISQPIEQSPDVDCVLHPSFPGMNSNEPFRAHVLTQSQWHRTLHKKDFRSIEECDDYRKKCWLFQELFGGEVRAISELENPPQVVLCAVPEFMMRTLGEETAGSSKYSTANPESLSSPDDGISRRFVGEFQCGLKSECMGTLPTEMMVCRSHATARPILDRATRAWNLSLALLHKAGVPPWRLANASENSCHVGISIFGISRTPYSDALKSFAHVVTELGNTFIVEGEIFNRDATRGHDLEYHLDAEHASSLLSRALAIFEKETGIAPRKVSVYKGTPYARAEREGFENALGNITQFGLMTIARRGLSCVRPGRAPILRGTAIPFDERVGLVFSSGYVPFLRSCCGIEMRQPLEIMENWGALPFSRAAQDLIQLTKLNLNAPDFCTDLPITLARGREIERVLQALGRKESSADGRYYF